MSHNILQEKHQLGIGGVAIGIAFNDISDEQSYEILKKAWEAGIRYFDTSPWYGLTKSERRFGDFLADKKKSEFILIMIFNYRCSASFCSFGKRICINYSGCKQSQTS